MGSQTVMLDRKKLEALFAELDVELDRIDASAEVYVAGGARMAFGLSDGRVTSDVDAAFRKTEGPVGQALAAVAERNGLAPDWINSAMVGSAPTSADTGESTLYEGRRLRIVGASPKRLLAMKVMALRDKDHNDIRALMKITGVGSVEQIETLVKEEYAYDQPGAGALAQLRLPEFAKWLQLEDQPGSASTRVETILQTRTDKARTEQEEIGEPPPNPATPPSPAQGASAERDRQIAERDPRQR